MDAARDRRPDAVDLVVALAFTLALQVEIWAPHLTGADTDLVQRPALSALSLAISLPLAFRRTRRGRRASSSLAAAAVLGRLDTPPEGLANLAAMLVVAYSLGRFTRPSARLRGRRAGPGLRGDARATTPPTRPSSASCSGRVGRRRRWSGRRSDDVRRSERQRLDAAAEGAEAERHRIASELHDVVAHRVSMIVVQSQAADALLDSDPSRPGGRSASVEEAARQALAELRQVVGVLKEESDGDPQALDLAGSARVVDDARCGGCRAPPSTSPATPGRWPRSWRSPCSASSRSP